MTEYQPALCTGSYSETWRQPLAICLLGNVRLLRAGELIPLRAGGKGEALLAHLALQHSRRVPREQVVQVLWPASELALGLNSLNNLVYKLQKLLGPALNGAAPILHREGYYRLNVEAGVAVDVACFDSLVDTGDAQSRAGDPAAILAYRRAAALYRGDLTLATDGHAIVERERLRARYLTLLMQLAAHAFGYGDYGASLEYLWRLLARDPYREDAHRLVMRCFVRLGERASALHQFRVCSGLLRAEFDTVPELATLALYEQIRVAPEQS